MMHAADVQCEFYMQRKTRHEPCQAAANATDHVQLCPCAMKHVHLAEIQVL